MEFPEINWTNFGRFLFWVILFWFFMPNHNKPKQTKKGNEEWSMD